jgi:hypothetical protein
VKKLQGSLDGWKVITGKVQSTPTVPVIWVGQDRPLLILTPIATTQTYCLWLCVFLQVLSIRLGGGDHHLEPLLSFCGWATRKVSLSFSLPLHLFILYLVILKSIFAKTTSLQGFLFWDIFSLFVDLKDLRCFVDQGRCGRTFSVLYYCEILLYHSWAYMQRNVAKQSCS